ncbi:MAG: hypothetical protein ACOC0U_06470 [Desulfovibrionales bacterium]
MASFIARDVRLSNAPWGSAKDMARLERIELQVKLTDLLFGRLRVKNLVFVGPELFIENNPSGTINVQFPIDPR